MKVVPAAALLALLAAPASAQSKGTFPLTDEWDGVSFELKSWGRPVVSWNISPGGAGLLTETITPEGAEFGRYDLVSHQLNVGRENYGKLASIIRRLPFPAPAYSACEERATDLPYGTLTVKQGSTQVTLDFNVGCQDAAYQGYVATLKQASDLVEAWAKASPIVRTEQIGLPAAEKTRPEAR